MSDLIEDAIKINMSNLDNFNIDIIKKLQDIADLHIDRHKILQVVINLISNATNALVDSDNNKNSIIISLTEVDDVVSVEVKDTGVGILDEDMQKLFQYGFTKRKNGHGFGLHNSALIAKELNGSITVESEGLGKGASFTFSFNRDG